jgi:hypothetical protein
MNAPDSKSEALEFMRRYGKAYRENDVAELRALRHTSFIFTSSRGWRISTEEELAEISSGNSRVHHSEVRQMDALVFDDTAVATGNIWIEGIWKGVPYSVELAITATLIRSASGWLMVAEHSSVVK